MGLVIVGSDRRGTAYGVFTVSEAIGCGTVTLGQSPPVTDHAKTSARLRGLRAICFQCFIVQASRGCKTTSVRMIRPRMKAEILMVSRRLAVGSRFRIETRCSDGDAGRIHFLTAPH